MSNSQRVVRRDGDGERGAIMVLAALLIVVLAIFAGGTFSGVTLYGANQEGRRAADLDALAAAATLPTANLTTCDTAICNPLALPTGNQFGTPLGSVNLDQALPLPNTNWASGSCFIAAEQFGNGRSPITDAYKTGADALTCDRVPQYSQPWMQHLADCIQAVSNCTDVQNTLASALPEAAGTPLGDAIQDALTAVDANQKLVSDTTMSTLNTLNTDAGPTGFCAPFGGPGCLTPLITALGGSRLQVNLAALAPALLTPEVKVTVTQKVRLPMAGLVGIDSHTVNNTATAKRAYKNAVLLPAFEPRPDGTYRINPNHTLEAARTRVLNALAVADRVVSPRFQAVLQPVMCPPPTPASECTVSSFAGEPISDLKDLFDPQGGEPPPDGNQILLDARQNARPVLLATVGRVVRPGEVLNNTIWTALAPLLGLGLNNLLVAPALDFVPAVLQDGGPLGYIATPVRTVTLAGQTQGLYRARLVD